MTRYYNLTVYYKYDVHTGFYTKHYNIIADNIFDSIRLNYVKLYLRGVYKVLKFEYDIVQ